MPSLLQERYEDLFELVDTTKAQIREAWSSGKVVEATLLEQKLAKLQKALGDDRTATAGQDPVVDEWIRQWDAGEVPDLGRAVRGPDGKVRIIEGGGS